MAIDVTSRTLAVTAAVAFTWVLAGRQLPPVRKGRRTVVALFVPVCNRDHPNALVESAIPAPA